MAILKSQTIGGTRIALERKPSKKGRKKYEYHVTEDGKTLMEPFDNKRDAADYYDEVVQAFKTREAEPGGETQSESTSPSLFGGGGGGFGLGGGGGNGGGIPGVGMGSRGSEDADAKDQKRSHPLFGSGGGSNGDSGPPTIPGFGTSSKDDDDDDDGFRFPGF